MILEIRIKRKEATISSDTIEIPAQGSANIPVILENDSSYSNYIKEVHCGYYLNGVYCKVILPIENKKYLIPPEAFKSSGPLYLAVALVNGKEIIKTNQINFVVRAAPNGKVILPTENEWHILVKNYMDSLFENDFGDRFDEIGTNLEEMAAEVQTQQEKITSQQTQIDNAIGNMGDYEIVQEDPVQIRFKKGDGTFGETVDLGDGLASKAMVNAGYYTYKGISYDGSASNNGIDVAEIDGAYSQETTNGFQLFDASKLPTKSQGGATVTNNGDGSFTISGSGNLTGDFSQFYQYTHEETLKMLKVGTITLNQNGDDTTPYALARLVKTGGTGIWLQLTKATQSANITQEMLQDVGCALQVFLYGSSGSTIQAGTIKPMLYQDGDGTFEPFTGGIASPNPEYPQEPKFVGDYNEGTKKYDIDIVSQTRNLFDASKLPTTSQEGVTVTNNDDGSFTISGEFNTTNNRFNVGYEYSHEETLKLLKVGKITLICEDVFPRFCMTLKKDGGYYANVNSHDRLTDTITQEMLNDPTCKLVIFIDSSGQPATLTTVKPMLYQQGNGEWESFKLKSTTVELNQPLRALPNGAKDTIENGSVIRHICEKTINNTTTIRYLDNLDLEKTIVFNIVVDKPLSNIMLCNNFLTNTKGYLILSNTDVEMIQIYTDRNIYIRINKSRLNENNLAGFKTWLQSNPVTVWYELATPTTEQITLPTLPSWYPYTNAWVGTELQPSFVEWHIKIAGVNQNDLTVIKEDISQLQTETTQLNDDVTKLMGAFTSVTDLTKQLFLLMHRVGDIIFSTSDENPSTIYGGTWVAWGKGQVPVGVDTSDSDFNTVEKTGGEKEHTLTVDETPSHKHDIYGGNTTTTNILTSPNNNGWITLLGGMAYKNDGTMTTVGNDEPHNNLQPYITCYMWKRVS